MSQSPQHPNSPDDAKAPPFDAPPIDAPSIDTSPAPQTPPAKGLGLASLILGILSLANIFWGGFAIGIIGAILAIVARKKGNKTDIAMTGLVLSLIGFVGGIAAFTLIFCIGFMP